MPGMHAVTFYISVGPAGGNWHWGIPVDVFVYLDPAPAHPTRRVSLEGSMWPVPEDASLWLKHFRSYTIGALHDPLMHRFHPWWRGCLRDQLMPRRARDHVDASGDGALCELRCATALSAACEADLRRAGAFTLDFCAQSGLDRAQHRDSLAAFSPPPEAASAAQGRTGA